MNQQIILVIWMLITTILIIGVFNTKYFSFLDSRSKKTNLEINGLRFFLSVGVAFHHFVYSFMYHSGKGWVVDGFNINFFIGRFSVAIFFIISGYLFYEKIAINTNWKAFYIKRFLRIAPMSFISSALCIYIAVYLDNGSFDLSKQIWNMLYWFDAGILNLRMDISSVPNASLINAGVTWTLYWEWLLYFSMPFLSLFIKKETKLPLVISIIAASYYIMPSFNYKAGCYAALFAFGFLAKEINTKTNKSFIINILPLLLIVSIIYIGSSSLTLPIIPLCFLFFISVNNTKSLFGVFNNRGVQRLGEISYSIYLLHGIAWYLMNINSNLSKITSLPYLFISSFVLLFTMIVCSLTYYFIEKPCMKFSVKMITKD
ncbi:acyltransferase family protein [Escherichia coli]|nr:acyltransferase [Escherichia coli]